MNLRVQDFFEKIKNKKIAFCGIGTSNLPIIKLFLEKGVNILACDIIERENASKEILELESLGINLKLGKDYLKNLDADVIFRSPGINFLSPELIKARENGITVTSEMEVFFDLCPCKIIAVTGSDGKTTTTTIISKILESAGKTVHLGGNIGTPLLPKIENIHKDDVAVVELSSFQLMSMRKSPDIAVITNIEPNHLDIHKDMSEYVLAKKNIFLHQDAFSKTVLNFDNELTKSFSDDCRGKTLFFSLSEKVPMGVFCKDNVIFYKDSNREIPILKPKDIKLPGKHNLANYMAAICAVFEDVTPQDIFNVAKTFSGVEHRIEFVRELNGVKYYNDSIASSPTRVTKGILSLFDQKIILICGGYDKKIPFDALADKIIDKVKILILMGQTADKIETAIKKSSKYNGINPKIIRVKNMEQAVNFAYSNSSCNDIVSLSPACASFDLYKNFDERGKHFKSLVNAL